MISHAPDPVTSVYRLDVILGCATAVLHTLLGSCAAMAKRAVASSAAYRSPEAACRHHQRTHHMSQRASAPSRRVTAAAGGSPTS